MKSSKLLKNFLISLAVILPLFLLASQTRILQRPVELISIPAVKLFGQLSWLRAIFTELKNIGHLVQENQRLKEENRHLLGEISTQSGLAKDNEFLRQALELPFETDKEIIDVGIFGISFTSEGHNLLINKGEKEGIKEGDVVVSASGVLVGQVNEVFYRYSQVRVVTDPDFKVTVVTKNSNISGLAKGAFNEGMDMDFVSQDDPIEKDELILTSGTDLLPGGILVGHVGAVEDRGVNIFKKVMIKTMLQEDNISKAIVIKL